MKETNIQEMKAKDIMSKKPVTVNCHDELSVVLGKMREHDVHDLPVVDGDKLVGLASYDTFLKRRSIPLTMKVEHFMSFPPKLAKDVSIMEIAELMLSSGYRSVPVTMEDKIIGIVSRSDLITIIPQMKELNSILVKEIMTQSPHCVSENDSLDKAKSLMSRLDVRALPVIDDHDKITGVVGFKDISEYAWRKKVSTRHGQRGGESAPLKIKIGSVMNSPPVTLPSDSKISEAAKLMQEYSISTIVVAENDVPVGIVTQYDLMELIASFQKKKKGVYVQISGLEMAESEIYDMMYELIQKAMKRLGRVVTPKVFTIHASMHSEGKDHHSGRYHLTGRLTTEHEMYYANAIDWDIMKCLSDMLSQLDRMIRKDQGKKHDTHKGKKHR